MLSFAGIDTKETYDIVKAISKKREDIIKSAKETFINGVIKHAKGDIKKIEKAAKDIWTIIESASRYGFNSPHALSVALDSLYIAYLKVAYPKETYTTLLDFYSIGKKRKINKIAEFKRELSRLGETVHPIRMGYTSDTTEYRDGGYVQSLLSVKGANIKLAKFLKTIRSDENPLLVYFKMKDTRDELGKSVGDKRSLTALCKMGYFDGIASNKKIMEYAPILYDNVYSKKQFRDTSIEKLKTLLNIDDIEIDKYISRKTAKTYYLDEAKKADFCLDLFNKIPDIEFSITEKALNQIGTYGYLVDYAMFKEHKIIDGYIKTVSQKEKYIIIVSHTTGSELKCYMKSMVGIKKKINILILGLQIKLKQVHVLNFKTYV
jgi:DNA polymerase III alpha subunit